MSKPIGMGSPIGSPASSVELVDMLVDTEGNNLVDTDENSLIEA